jgi:hypothetical protein
MPRRFAVYHPSGQTAIKTDPAGKDIANIEMLRALARHGGYEHLHISTTSLAHGWAVPHGRHGVRTN